MQSLSVFRKISYITFKDARMLRKTNRFLLIMSILSMLSLTAVAESVLRVSCDGAGEGARVYINGQYKGDCPSDIFLSSGSTKLRVVKPVNEEYERVYEEEFYLADSIAKRVDAQLSGPQLSEVGRKNKERQEKKAAEAALASAKEGDVESMKLVAKLYEQGKGLPQSDQNADDWRKRAENAKERAMASAILKQAKSGDVRSMRRMSELYEQGKGVAQNRQSAQEWKDQADTVDARAALESAKEGNIDAMRKIAEYYAEGKGVEQNSVESELWAKKAQAKADQQQREARQAKINREAQEAIDRINFFGNTKDGWDLLSDSSSSVFITTGPVMTLTSLASDVITTPYRLTKVRQLRSRMASRPSTFGKPDSMIAKAYHQRDDAGI